MNPLLDFDRRHGISTTLVGGVSGALSWLFAHTADITQVAGMLGALATAGLALLTLTVKLIRVARDLRAWWTQRGRNRGQRRRHLRDEPFDELP